MAGYRRVWTGMGGLGFGACSSLTSSPACVFSCTRSLSSLPCVFALLQHVSSFLRERDWCGKRAIRVSNWYWVCLPLVRAFRAAGRASGRGRREERLTSSQGVGAVAAACVERKLSALGTNTHPLFRCGLVFFFSLFSFIFTAFSSSVVLIIYRLRVWITESMLHFAVLGISERDRESVCGEVFFASVCVSVRNRCGGRRYWEHSSQCNTFVFFVCKVGYLLYVRGH